jgi:hypothetical protein
MKLNFHIKIIKVIDKNSTNDCEENIINSFNNKLLEIKHITRRPIFSDRTLANIKRLNNSSTGC